MSGRLNVYAKNVYSQFGEDGIIEYLLERLSAQSGWCVEFGAWDGMHLSNTFNLVKNRGYRSVLIEADREKYVKLAENMAQYGAVVVNAMVSFEGDSTLDRILEGTDIPVEFDVLSVDIDGNDYWVLESLAKYRPKIICIEYNPSIPNDVHYVQPRDFGVNRGASARAINELAKQMGYELVAATASNLIFVDGRYYELCGLDNNELNSVRDDSESKVYAFVGYDGTIMHSRPIWLRWHGIEISGSHLQLLPSPLRKFSSYYSFGERLFFKLFKVFRRIG